MARFIKVFFRSFFVTLFIAVVCSAAVTVVMIPAVGRKVAEPLCGGTVESRTAQFSQENGEFGTKVGYTCVAENGESQPISMPDILIQAAIYYVVLMGVVVWPIVFILSFMLYGKLRNRPEVFHGT